MEWLPIEFEAPGVARQVLLAWDQPQRASYPTCPKLVQLGLGKDCMEAIAYVYSRSVFHGTPVQSVLHVDVRYHPGREIQAPQWLNASHDASTEVDHICTYHAGSIKRIICFLYVSMPSVEF